MFDLITQEEIITTECEIWSGSKSSVMLKLGKWVKALQQNVALDRFGRPMSYVDAEIVLTNTITFHNLEEFLDYPPEGVFIPIDYSQGYGTANGFPIWERLEGETLEYYNIFKAYLYLHEEQLKPLRMIEELEMRTRANSRQIKALMNIYHWQLRADEYDHFKEMHIQKQKEVAIIQMENKHHKMADKIMDKIGQTLETMNFETQELKDLIKLMELAVKLQRLSLGQDPTKPGTGEKPMEQQVHQIGSNYQINLGNQSTEQKKLASIEDSEQDVEDMAEIIAIMQACGAIPPTELGEEVEKAIAHVNTKPISGSDEDGEHDKE